MSFLNGIDRKNNKHGNGGDTKSNSHFFSLFHLEKV